MPAPILPIGPPAGKPEHDDTCGLDFGDDDISCPGCLAETNLMFPKLYSESRSCDTGVTQENREDVVEGVSGLAGNGGFANPIPESFLSPSCVLPESLLSHNSDITSAIVACLPERPEQFRWKVFALCRHLQAKPELRELDPRSLRSVVMEWHRQAGKAVGDNGPSEAFFEFLRGWPLVRCPAGQGAVDVAWEYALKAVPSSLVMELYPCEDEMRLLACLCRELQQIQGEERDFFLTARAAQKLLSLSHPMKAWRRLQSLCDDNVLLAGPKGSKETELANCYRYIGG